MLPTIASGVAASLRGKLLHLSYTRVGKTGRIPIPRIDAIAEGKENAWSVDLESELAFVKQQLGLPHVRPYPHL